MISDPSAAANDNGSTIRVDGQAGGSLVIICGKCGNHIRATDAARALGAAGGRRSRRKLSGDDIACLKAARAAKRIVEAQDGQ